MAVTPVAQTVNAARCRAGFVGAFLICCFQPAAAIVGGVARTVGSIPYHVVLIEDSNKKSCTGTVLTRELVLFNLS
jgi:hypothetical protein